MKTAKIAVTGAAGQLGYALLFRIAAGDMLGLATPLELQLLEVESALPRLRGIMLELEDCAFPLLKKITCTADTHLAMREANWVILVGSAPSDPHSLYRFDLLRPNAELLINQARAINEQAAIDVRVLVVTNPCNSNALIVLHHAPNIPHNRVFALTRLDELRARHQLARKAKVGVETITQMIIWGNHSATQYPDFYHANIAGKRVTEVITDLTWLQQDFIATIQNRGRAILEARGVSSAASAAEAIISCIYHIQYDTPYNESFSLGCYSEGEYHIDEGLIFSFPCRTQAGKVKIVRGIEHNTFGQEKINITLRELRKEYQVLKELKLIK